MLDISNEILVCTKYGGIQFGHERFLEWGRDILDKQRRGKHKGMLMVKEQRLRLSCHLI